MAALVTAGADPAILFIKRRERAGDPWSGQMALPGGFASPVDGSLEATARRETEEETGIALDSTGVLLGVLDDVSPRTPFLPPLIVSPYVFEVPGRLEATAGPEAERAMWLRVRDLLDPAFRKPYVLRLPGATREFDSILRLQSGETAVLAGLMQDQVQNTDTGIPGVRTIPLVGEALANRADLTTKTELVIFLRATVIRDPSVEGDFRGFREQLPREDFFSKPNPQKSAPAVLPGQSTP